MTKVDTRRRDVLPLFPVRSRLLGPGGDFTYGVKDGLYGWKDDGTICPDAHCSYLITPHGDIASIEVVEDITEEDR